MTNLTRITFLIIAVTLPNFLNAQSINVKRETCRIKGVNTEGYSVVLEGKDVSSAYIKYLKTFAKVKQGFEYHTLSEMNIEGKTYTPNAYATVKENENKSEVWIGINTDEWKGNDVDAMNKHLEKIIYNFGVQFYKDKVQLQIDESTRALQAVEKQQQRLVNQNRDFNMKLEDNKREKIQLEKALENNKIEYETLLKKIDQNKKDQDSVQIANDQIKKVIEMQKEKQRKVGS